LRPGPGAYPRRPDPPPAHRRPAGEGTMSPRGGSPDPVAEAAARMGRELCRTAVWDAERRMCNWVGRSDVEDPAGGLATATIALYAPLAGGSAGVALFLGELAARTGDAAAGATAAGALRRSVHHLRVRENPSQALSFFTGTLGVAFAGRRLAELGILEEDEVDVPWLLGRAEDALVAEHPLDWMGGDAGAIPALLWLAGRTGMETRCLTLARSCGDRLRREATWEDDRCGWDAARATGHSMQCPPLTGFSHGASGMALALLELHARTGDPELLRTARGALAYEDAWFSARGGNWADLRFPHSRDGDEVTGTLQGAWCHGAPGIGLARARAALLDPEQGNAHARMARIALDTTVELVRARRATPRADATLCHGMGGLSEILLIAAGLLDEPRYADEARATALALAERHGPAGDWPCGTTTGEPNPAFLIGVPGIGHHFLRVASPGTVEPVLLVRAGDGPAARKPGRRAGSRLARMG
ncbi:MAG TPA: lanthionine synthetase LanC family protein, partial [Longimicrobium sp.]|nr:lanthionine synthetase LanC family protein [Longimicrobium sp.]